MKNLPMPTDDDVAEHLTTALTYVDGTQVYPLTQQERIEVVRLYRNYDLSLGRPVQEFMQAPTLSVALKDAIHTAYNEVQEKGRLRRLREQLMLVANRCPLCGIGPATDLDHHLPHSTYKALSIYSRNLVPICHKCNGKKRTVAGENPDDRFVHVYFDVLPGERFLVANASLVGDSLVVEYGIVQTPGMLDDLFASLKFQMGRLNLNERYQPEINIFLSSQITALSDAYGTDHNNVRLKDFITRSARSLESTLGMNDWRASLMYALAGCDAFCAGGFLRALGQRQGQ